MALILYGKPVREEHTKALKSGLSKLPFQPKLAIVQVGDVAESDIYIEAKKNYGKEIGVAVEHVRFPGGATQKEVARKISELNALSSVHGIIIQLPLPAHFDKDALINAIAPRKDVDGLTAVSREKFDREDEDAFVPATALAVRSILRFYNINPRKSKVAVLGRSNLVGRPTAKLLEREDADVAVCHSKTADTKEIVRRSDIAVIAIGKPHLIDRSYFTGHQVVIDVGISRVEEEVEGRKIAGDVNLNDVLPFVSAISPVPGGVGLMTVVSLFENVFKAAKAKI